MSIVQRHIILGAGLSIIIFIFITAAMITAYPLPDWSQLWDRELMNIPFIVFFCRVSVLLLVSSLGLYQDYIGANKFRSLILACIR